MAIVCSHCDHKMGVDVRPDKVGGFRIRCNKCDGRLWLLVPEQSRGWPMICVKRSPDEVDPPPYPEPPPTPKATAKPPAPPAASNSDVIELEIDSDGSMSDQGLDLDLESDDLDLDLDTDDEEEEDDDLASLAMEIERELEARMSEAASEDTDHLDSGGASRKGDQAADDTAAGISTSTDGPARGKPTGSPSQNARQTMPKPQPKPVDKSSESAFEFDDDDDVIPMDDSHLPADLRSSSKGSRSGASGKKPGSSSANNTNTGKMAKSKPVAPAPRPTAPAKPPTSPSAPAKDRRAMPDDVTLPGEGSRATSESPTVDEEVSLSDADLVDGPDDATIAGASQPASKPTSKPSRPPATISTGEQTLPSESRQSVPRHTTPSSDATLPSEGGGGGATIAAAWAATMAGAAGAAADVTSPSADAGAHRPSPVPAAAPANGHDRLGRLGGYELVRELGRGGMGNVYLARQLSLDRDVAIKTMNEQWANNPAFLARFTREAYAAAQLVHHNVVQIYDIGEDKQTNYFSMEFVRGRSLGQVVRESGPLDVEEAVGYILQAARGLRYAEQQGMTHRDIKPDNLMLNEQGIVKVADLGLVKTPGSVEAEEREAASGGAKPAIAAPEGASKLSQITDVTRADVAMGTPAYMAPEQARDARNVDIRADVYSLGCTLYVLLTGKPVHEGRTAQELITKHATEPIVPPDAVVKRVPKELSAIILKMVAKEPADRYQNMDELIKALEAFLGVDSAGPFTPREEHARVLEETVAKYNQSSMAKLRHRAILGFYGVSALMMVILALMGRPMAVGAMIALMVLAAGSYFVITGITHKTFVFRKVRQLVFGSSVTDWLLWTAGLTAALIILYVFGQLWIWLGVAVVAAGLAAVFHFVVDRKVRQDRKPFLDEAEQLLKSMRLRGLEEEAIRQFVCTYSGDHWEAFYEDLFDYEAKMQARQRWGKGIRGKDRKKYGPWRDALIAWIEERMKQRQAARERRYLQKVQERELRAKGLNEKEARAQAEAGADTMVSGAEAFKVTMAAMAMPQPVPAGGAAAPRAKTLQDLLRGEEVDEAARKREKARARGGKAPLSALLFGKRMRFVLAVASIAICTLWLHQNGLIGEGAGTAYNIETARNVAEQGDSLPPLRLPFVPEAVLVWFSGVNIGVAGLILLASVFLGRVRISLLVLPAAAITAFGHRLGVIPTDLPIIGSATEYATIAIGVVLAMLGVLFLRK